MRTAVLAGSTGVIGTALLELLLDSPRYSSVISAVRRNTGRSHPKLNTLTVDFRNPEKALAGNSVDDVFCCLGTTMAKAGSKEAFLEVDHDFPLVFARATHGLGARQFHLVSAMGAKQGSSVFYNHVKGLTEDDIRKVGFASYHIYRPSLLLGQRNESRPGEAIAKQVFKYLDFLIPSKYKGIYPDAVAYAMVNSAHESREGIFIHESAEMRAAWQKQQRK